MDAAPKICQIRSKRECHSGCCQFAILSTLIGLEGCYGLSDWLKMPPLQNMTIWRNFMVSRMALRLKHCQWRQEARITTLGRDNNYTSLFLFQICHRPSVIGQNGSGPWAGPEPFTPVTDRWWRICNKNRSEHHPDPDLRHCFCECRREYGGRFGKPRICVAFLASVRPPRLMRQRAYVLSEAHPWSRKAAAAPL